MANEKEDANDLRLSLTLGGFGENRKANTTPLPPPPPPPPPTTATHTPFPFNNLLRSGVGFPFMQPQLLRSSSSSSVFGDVFLHQPNSSTAGN